MKGVLFTRRSPPEWGAYCTPILSSDEGGDNWAVIATLIENCKLSGINPHAWLTETLTSLADGHPANAVAELMPWAAVA